MNQLLARLIGICALVALAACSGQSTSLPAGTTAGNSAGGYTLPPNVRSACSAAVPAGQARCFALYRTDVGDVGSGPRPGSWYLRGYGPSQLHSAYNLSPTGGTGQTVAIVDAFNDPNAEADLQVYRGRYGLPRCTTANGCFKKVNQTGGTAYPPNDAGWAEEISLDLDMVSAICPNCHILLVEGTDNSFANLGTAVSEAVTLGAQVVSNSYGGGEGSAGDPNYNHAGHEIVASAGDSGTGAQQPCSFATVVCVGGTSLKHTGTGRGWSEVVWPGTGSGCSAFVPKPSWQTDTGTGKCPMRSESDVSAVADPATGVNAYDTFADATHEVHGWLVFGGTSVASPIIGAVYALAGNATSQNAAKGIWNDAGAHLFDVTSGSNGTCTYPYICNAGPGYDGPTGWGTPNGTTAF